MNLVGFAARLAFQYAVMGNTLAGQQVFNAPIEPIDTLLKSRNKLPLVAIYTGAVRGNPNGTDMFGTTDASQVLELVAQVYLPPGDLTLNGVDFALQNDGAGSAIDFVWRQVHVALSMPTNPWAEIYRKIVRSYAGFDSRPVLIELDKGGRIPCREISWLCKVIPEPQAGVALNPLWQKIDALMRDNPDLEPLADVVKNLIEAPAGMPSWRLIQNRLNWTTEQVRAAGVAPFDETETGEATDLTDGTIYDGDDPPPPPEDGP